MQATLIVIAILLAIIVVMLWLGGVAAFAYVRTAVKHLADNNRAILEKLDGIKTEVDKKGHVVDPFKVANKTNSVGAPTRHIIPRNSPDFIRNQHAEEIKAGLGSFGNPE